MTHDSRKNRSTSRMSLRSLGLVGLLGGLGGAINGWLSYLKLPVSPHHDFSWPIILSWSFHGAVLAVLSVGAAITLFERALLIRWIALPIVGYLTAWLAWIPVGLYFAFQTTGQPFITKVAVAIRPLTFATESEFEALSLLFGFGALTYYFLLAVCRGLRARWLLAHIIMACSSGVLGLLVWWVKDKPWYLGVIHGTIWGSLVGFGVWKAQRAGIVERSR